MLFQAVKNKGREDESTEVPLQDWREYLERAVAVRVQLVDSEQGWVFDASKGWDES